MRAPILMLTVAAIGWLPETRADADAPLNAQTIAQDAAAPQTTPDETAPLTPPQDSPTLPDSDSNTEPGSGETPIVDTKDEAERRSRRGIGFALRASTLGLGAEGIYSLNRFINLRAQVNGFSTSHDITDKGNNYGGKLKFLTYGALADWHPFAGSFRISAGAFGNDNKIDLNGDCKGGCNVGDFRITTSDAQTGRLRGSLKFDSFSPYAGIGWGNAMYGSRLHFAFDLGALYQGKPKVDLSASGTATVDRQDGSAPFAEDVGADTSVQAQVLKEQDKARDGVKEFRFYPVISLTLGYRFGG